MPTRPPTACTSPGCANPRPCSSHPRSWGEGMRGRAMPPGWAATRRRIMLRDAFTCRECGGPATEVDHMLPGVEGDDYLRAMCHGCHAARTAAQAQAARQGHSAPRWRPNSGNPVPRAQARPAAVYGPYRGGDGQ